MRANTHILIYKCSNTQRYTRHSRNEWNCEYIKKREAKKIIIMRLLSATHEISMSIRGRVKKIIIIHRTNTAAAVCIYIYRQPGGGTTRKRESAREKSIYTYIYVYI